MGQYFFKVSKAEKNDILDQHKKIYDGYVTLYGQNNQQPLMVQDFANDKNGITVSNKGNVMSYQNMNINESHTMKDKIADGPNDLKNGTVDVDSVFDSEEQNFDFLHDLYPSPNENEFDIVSLGVSPEGECLECESNTPMMETEDTGINLRDFDFGDYDIPSVDDIFSYEMREIENAIKSDMTDPDDYEKLEESLNRTKEMFNKFKSYN